MGGWLTAFLLIWPSDQELIKNYFLLPSFPVLGQEFLNRTPNYHMTANFSRFKRVVAQNVEMQARAIGQGLAVDNGQAGRICYGQLGFVIAGHVVILIDHNI
jgi:hypothetical protein